MSDYELIFTDAVIKTTKRAVLFEIEGQEIWVPRAVIDGGDEIKDPSDFDDAPRDGEYYIQTWFCKKEGLL